MPRNKDIKKVLVIGSGPIVIGQAAEFDYAGTQACRSLKEEGLEVVLLNSNPATIMTDKDIADRVYIEPLTVEVVEQLILKEKPDSVLPTLGGQAGLNLAMELEEAGFLKEHNVRLIGTTAETIKKAEDRLEFKDTMEKIGEPVAASLVVENIEDGVAFADKIGYPVVLRPAYTLGGSGGGIAHDQEQLEEILENGLRLSRVGQVLVERCIAGWKEIEYEVMRDSAGNCITVCNMENIDPVGVHTGDSIVVAPSQTLGDKEYQMLRTSALNIITELNITGGCNVQYALNPDSFEYCVIEVNPRVSRSSALASKATGYPIAKVAAKIALGYTLDEIKNAVTKKTYASFEPMLDYCVVKMPRLPFDKFISAKRTLTTQMKATGEVMSICDNFEGALSFSMALNLVAIVLAMTGVLNPVVGALVHNAGSVLLSDGALYGALGQGQITLVHIYRVLEGGCTGPQVEGRAGDSIAGEAAHRAAVLGDDKLHPRALEGGAELSDLLGVEGAAEPAAGKDGDAGHDGTLLSPEKALFPTAARRAAPQPRAQNSTRKGYDL